MTEGGEHTAIFQLPSVIAGQLVCVAGTAKGQSWPLSAGTFIIGRLPDLDLPLPNEIGVSKSHAKIVAEGLHYAIYDTASRNGTLVNGQPVQKAELRDGDEIRICGCVLRFSQTQASAEGDGAVAAAAAAAPEPVTTPAPEAAPAPAPEPVPVPAPEPAAAVAPSTEPESSSAPAEEPEQKAAAETAGDDVDLSEEPSAQSELDDVDVDMDEGQDSGAEEKTEAESKEADADADAKNDNVEDPVALKKRRRKVLLRDALAGMLIAIFFVAGPSFALIGFGPELLDDDEGAFAEGDGGVENDAGEDDAGSDGGEELSDTERAELAALTGEGSDAGAVDANAGAAQDRSDAGEVVDGGNTDSGENALLARVNALDEDVEDAIEEEEEILPDEDDDYDEEDDTSYRNPKPRKKKKSKRARKAKKRKVDYSSYGSRDDDDDDEEVREIPAYAPPKKKDRRPSPRRYARLSTGWFPVRVVAGEPVVVRARIGGRIRTLNYPQGARVEEGESLAEMDMRSTDAKIETLKVSIQALEGVAASQDDAKAYLREEKAKLRRLIAARKKSSVPSPTTGRLTEVFISEGDRIRARHVVAKVMPENTNEVFARVPEAIGRALDPGAPAEFRLSNGQIRDGRVRAIKQQQQSDYRVLLQGKPRDLRRVQEVRFP